MEKLTVYEKPTCTTCKKTIKLLNELGYEFNRINYYVKPFSKNKLKTLLKKMQITPEELLRKNDPAFKELDLKHKSCTKEQFITFMVENPDLVQRPIVEKGEKAVLARPVEKIKELFNNG